MDVSKESLNINKLMCEKNEIINIQGDMIIPDAKPDILNTINTSGNICIYKKDLQDGKVKIDGGVNVYIMYLADSTDEIVRGINTNLDFSEIINVPNCTSNMLLKMECAIKSIDCNVINGRKINIKVGIDVKIKIYSNEEEKIINKIEKNEEIQILEKDLKINSQIRKRRNNSIYKRKHSNKS